MYAEMSHKRAWLEPANPYAVLHNNSNNNSNAEEGVDNSSLVLRSALADVTHTENFTELFPAMSTLPEGVIKASIGLAASTAVIRTRTLKEKFKRVILDNRVLHYQFHNGAFVNDPDAAKKLVMHNMAMQRYLFGMPPLSNSQAGGAHRGGSVAVASAIGPGEAAAAPTAAAAAARNAAARNAAARNAATTAFTAQLTAAAATKGARAPAPYAPPSDIDFTSVIRGLDEQFNTTAQRLEAIADADWWHENEVFFKDVLPNTFIYIYNELKWILGSVASYTDAKKKRIATRREIIKSILQGTYWTATPTSFGALQGAEVAKAGAEEAPAVEAAAAALAVPDARIEKANDLMEKAWGTGEIDSARLTNVGLTYPLPSITAEITEILDYLERDEADTYYELIDRLIKLILDPRTREGDIAEFLAGFKALYADHYDVKYDKPIGMTLATHLKSLFASRGTILKQTFNYSYTTQTHYEREIMKAEDGFFNSWDRKCREIVLHLQNETKYAGLERYVWRFGSWMPSVDFFKKTSALKAIYETGFERYAAHADVANRAALVEQVQYPSGPNKTKLHIGVSIIDTQGRWSVDPIGEFYPSDTRYLYKQLFYENPNEFLGPDTLFCVKPNVVFVEYMRHLDELHRQNGFGLEMARLERIQENRAALRGIIRPGLRAIADQAAAVAADPGRRAAALSNAGLKVAGIRAGAQEIAADLAAVAASAGAPTAVKAGVGAVGAAAASTAAAAASSAAGSVAAAGGVCAVGGNALLCALGTAAPPVGAALVAGAAVYGLYRYATAVPAVTNKDKERQIQMANFIRRRDIIAGLAKPTFRDVREMRREESIFEMLANEGVASLATAIEIEVGKRGLFKDGITKGVSSIMQNFLLCRQTAQANEEARRTFFAVRAMNLAVGSPISTDAAQKCVENAVLEANTYLTTLRRHNVSGRVTGSTTRPDYVSKGIADILAAFRGNTPVGKVVNYVEDVPGSIGHFLLMNEGDPLPAPAAGPAGPAAALSLAEQQILRRGMAAEAERLAREQGEINAAAAEREAAALAAADRRRAAATANLEAAAARAGAAAKAAWLAAQKREVDPTTKLQLPYTPAQLAAAEAAAASAVIEYKALHPVLIGGRRKSRKGGAARFGRTTARSTAAYNVPSVNTIEAVKARIQNKEGIPSNQQRLIFTGLNNSTITQGPVDLNLSPEVLVLKYVDLDRLLVGTTLQEFVSNLFDVVLDTPQLRYAASYYTYKVNTLTHIMLPKYMPVDNLDTQLVSMSKRFTSPLRGGAAKPPRAPAPAAAAAAGTGFSIARVAVARPALAAPPPAPAALEALAAKGGALGAMVAAAAAAPVAVAHEDVAALVYTPSAAAPSNWPDYLERRDQILISLQSRLSTLLSQDAPRVQAVLKEHAAAYNGILETFAKDRVTIAGIREKAKADAAAANTAATSNLISVAGGAAQLVGWASGSSTLMDIGKGLYGAKNLTSAGAAVLAPLTRDGLEAAAKAKQEAAEAALKAKKESGSEAERAAARKEKHTADIDYIGSLLMSDKSTLDKYNALELKLKAAAVDDNAAITLYSEALGILIDGDETIDDKVKNAWKAAVGKIIATKTELARSVASVPAPVELARPAAQRELVAAAAQARIASAAAASGAPKAASAARTVAPAPAPAPAPPAPAPAEADPLADRLRGIPVADRFKFFNTDRERLTVGNTNAQKAALWEWATQAGATGPQPGTKAALIKKVKELLAKPVPAVSPGTVAAAPTPRVPRSGAAPPAGANVRAAAAAARAAPVAEEAAFGGATATRRDRRKKKQRSFRKPGGKSNRVTLKNRRRRQFRKTYRR